MISKAMELPRMPTGEEMMEAARHDLRGWYLKHLRPRELAAMKLRGMESKLEKPRKIR